MKNTPIRAYEQTESISQSITSDILLLSLSGFMLIAVNELQLAVKLHFRL